jgi:hypothetical protein
MTGVSWFLCAGCGRRVFRAWAIARLVQQSDGRLSLREQIEGVCARHDVVVHELIGSADIPERLLAVTQPQQIRPRTVSAWQRAVATELLAPRALKRRA